MGCANQPALPSLTKLVADLDYSGSNQVICSFNISLNNDRRMNDVLASINSHKAPEMIEGVYDSIHSFGNGGGGAFTAELHLPLLNDDSSLVEFGGPLPLRLRSDAVPCF